MLLGLSTIRYQPNVDLQQLIRIINNLVSNPSRARNKDSIVNPTISRIACLHSHMQPHLETISCYARIVSQLLQHFLLASSGSGGLQIDSGTIVSQQIVPRVEMSSLLITMISHNLPVTTAWQDLTTDPRTLKATSLENDCASVSVRPLTYVAE